MTDEFEKIIRDSLGETRRESFDKGFSDRVLTRWKAEREPSMGDIIAKEMRRLAPIGVAAALLLAFYNVRGPESSPAVDRLLGLTTVTVDAVYDLGTGRSN